MNFFGEWLWRGEAGTSWRMHGASSKPQSCKRAQIGPRCCHLKRTQELLGPDPTNPKIEDHKIPIGGYGGSGSLQDFPNSIE